MSYQMTGLGTSVEDCLKQVKVADMDSAAGREKAARAAAACAADGFCAAYKVPPGPCGYIADKVVGAIVDVWNSVWGDDAHERAVLMAQMDVQVLGSQMARLSDKFQAAYRNAAARLIDLNDQLLVHKKGALGGGVPSTVTIKGSSKYSSPWAFSYKYYPDHCKAYAKLVECGAPFGGVGGAGGSAWCAEPNLRGLYYSWTQSHGTASSITQVQQIKLHIKIYEQWMVALSVAEVAAQVEIETAAWKIKPLYVTMSTPMSTPTKVVLVAGGAGLLWWVGKKLLF